MWGGKHEDSPHLMRYSKNVYFILLFSVGYLIIQRNMEDRDYSQIFSICKIVGCFESIVVLIQYFFPTLFYTFAKYWFFYSDQYEQVEYLGKWCKQYSGLFYEVSYAAVIIAVSIVVMFVDLVGGDIYTIPTYLREKKKYPYYNRLVEFGNIALKQNKKMIIYGNIVCDRIIAVDHLSRIV